MGYGCYMFAFYDSPASGTTKITIIQCKNNNAAGICYEMYYEIKENSGDTIAQQISAFNPVSRITHPVSLGRRAPTLKLQRNARLAVGRRIYHRIMIIPPPPTPPNRKVVPY